MNFLKYANETQTNIFPKENFEMLVQEVFNVISTNICRSLGPLGSSATILEGMTPPEATKDGYSILDKYRFHNDYKKMIYNLIKAPCTKMNNSVGDGTTTAIALTTALFNRYKQRRDSLEVLYRLPRQFTKAWDSVIEELQTEIQKKSVMIDPKDFDTIYNIAYVTSNGNEEISNAIAKVYSEAETPFIKQKDSPTNESYIEMVEGFSFPANLIDDIFIRNQDLTVEEKNIAVLIFDFKLETDFFKKVIIPINEVYRAQGIKLLVIAPSYDKVMCDTLLDQYIRMEANRFGINLILAQYSTSSLKPNQLLDLSVILRTKIINEGIADILLNEINAGSSIDQIVENAENDKEYSLYRLVGHAESALLSIYAGSIFKVKDINDDERYQEIYNKAKRNLDDIIAHTDMEAQSYSAKIYDARERLLQLQMKNYIYYIGADSNLQKNIIWDSVNDVIKCVRSAVKYGVVPGCQLSIITACDEILNSIKHMDENTISENDKLKYEIVDIIRSACCDVYMQILHGPDNLGMIKLMPRWNYTTPEGIDDLKKEAVKKSIDIVTESIEKYQVFDMESLEFSSKIITSAETDRMVLLAASELIKILISGNQCIILRTDVDASHEETREAYV